MRQKRNIGFDKRLFLTEDEWKTYCRRKPVRYIRRPKNPLCEVCGLAADITNPLQHAHIIGFDLGIIDLALTPDFLDSNKNITIAHRSKCNKYAELDLRSAIMRLKILEIKELPAFLPKIIHEYWQHITS